jgi:hypothetical protein
MLTDRDLALLCAATYQPGVKWAFAGPTFHATLAYPDTSQVVIAIEGSASLLDWADDFDIVGPTSYDHPDLGEVHAGFDRTTDECLPEIVRACGGRAVTITGHSKGGANAEMLAAKLFIAGLIVARLVTFGTPRWVKASNTKLPAFLSSTLGRSYRHTKDVVTEVPLGWAHPATRSPVEVGTGTFRQLLDVEWMHSIDNYAAALA